MGLNLHQDAWGPVLDAAQREKAAGRSTLIGIASDNTEQAAEREGWDLIAVYMFAQVLARDGDRIMLAYYHGRGEESRVAAVDVTAAYEAVVRQWDAKEQT